MMELLLLPRRLRGSVTPPPSKSQTQRLLLCAALAEGTSSLHNIYFSDDIRASLRCAEALGAAWESRDGGALHITGIGGRRHGGPPPRFDCGESGTTLRLFLPVSLAAVGGGVFTGRGRLMRRPLEPYRRQLTEKGLAWEAGGDTLRVSGRLPSGEYRLPGDVSSQFFSGLLLALPLTDGPSYLRASTAPESADYIRMTIEAQEKAGLRIEPVADGFRVEPQPYRPFEAAVEADWSQAAFWIAARELGNAVELRGLNGQSSQADRRMAAFARRLAGEGDVTLEVSQCPDLLPPLAALAALRRGVCRLTGAARLRLKESDRLRSVTAALRALGADVREEPAALEIRGRESLRGGRVDCCGDHRVAMMAAVAATRCDGPVRLSGADCVKKSYPDFWEVYQSLGGECHVIDLG